MDKMTIYLNMICSFMKYWVRCNTITKSSKVYMIMNRYALHYFLILSNTTMVTYACIHMELYSFIRYLDFKRSRHENWVRMLPHHTILSGIWTSKESNMRTNNVLKIGPVIEPEKLPIQGLGAKSIIEPQSNWIKSGLKRSLVDSPTNQTDQFNSVFKTLLTNNPHKNKFPP